MILSSQFFQHLSWQALITNGVAQEQYSLLYSVGFVTLCIAESVMEENASVGLGLASIRPTTTRWREDGRKAQPY